MGSVRDLIGQRFGHLVVLRRAGSTRQRAALWECACDCGSRSVAVSGASLVSGATKSCGCQRYLRKHGHAKRGRPSSTYRSWAAMINRCSNPTHPRFARYGGRGITVCDHWRLFENFLADMGGRPGSAYSIDRIDNDGSYGPGNCRWATRREQQNNQRTNRFFDFDGERLTEAEIARRSDVNRSTLHSRLRHGWPIDDAVSGRRAPLPTS